MKQWTWVIVCMVCALGAAEADQKALSARKPFAIDCDALDGGDWRKQSAMPLEAIARDLDISIAWHLFCRGRSGKDAITFFEPTVAIPWYERTEQERLVLIKSYKIGRLAYDDPAVARAIEPHTSSKEVFFEWVVGQICAAQERVKKRGQRRRHLGCRHFISYGTRVEGGRTIWVREPRSRGGHL